LSALDVRFGSRTVPPSSLSDASAASAAVDFRAQRFAKKLPLQINSGQDNALVAVWTIAG
jgi:hypothetical protein